ncbi:unnamed protein product [Prorocentrum cordatum]|uniref:Uncharacterized protein n=1 Tax=Prorocentrum cordatum TaxID=2364126 RepID=A0ABN9QPY9_9DINO|nr:unnamed protein product [Polarella glacialis]
MMTIECEPCSESARITTSSDEKNERWEEKYIHEISINSYCGRAALIAIFRERPAGLSPHGGSLAGCYRACNGKSRTRGPRDARAGGGGGRGRARDGGGYGIMQEQIASLSQ